MQLLLFLLFSLNPVSEQQLYKYDADEVIHKEKISLLCGNVSFFAKDLTICGDTLTFHRDDVVLMSNQAQIFTKEGTEIQVQDLHFDLRPFRFDGKKIKILKVNDSQATKKD